MKIARFLDLDCVPLENAALSLLVTRSVGPRIISLRLNGGENLLAELPDFVTRLPDGGIYHFYGGHRLWHAPENMPSSYSPDDGPVEVRPSEDGLTAIQPVEVQTGIEKSIQLSLAGSAAQVTLRHTLTNRAARPVECAPWAITQLRSGGVAILPQSREQTGVLPNRCLALWPYADFANPGVSWGDRYILVRASMRAPFKLGFPNPRGWLAYWLEGTLFVKRAAFEPGGEYGDFGSSSECYCNDRFLELETLAPLSRLAPGESAAHVETWELYADIEAPENEDAAQRIVER
ncbi:MAG: hypothetical protein ACM3QS_07735, partial [Bacteroidota bacterium]